MPRQVIPITQLDKAGLIEDMPSVSLPPSAFSAVGNVRFDDGAIHSMKAEGDLVGIAGDNIVYAVSWRASDGEEYLIKITDDGSTVSLRSYTEGSSNWAFSTITLDAGVTLTPGGGWQHTIFNGGYHLILNNGLNTPIYLTAGSNTATTLPGWDSYAAERTLLSYESDGGGGSTSFAITLEAGTKIKVTNIPRNLSIPIYSETVTINAGVDGVTTDGTLQNIGTIDTISVDGFNFTPNDNTGGNTFEVAIVSPPVATVRAGVIRSYGNLLVAGNLMEVDDEGGTRTLTGTVRTSDVAAPGEVPTNWNPFERGVNTADEFILASTGIIQDMVELQGVLYVYTDSSIHAISQTGSPVIPFQISTVTDNYGCDRTGGVLEVDGKHIVCGSEDVYVFAGHPGSISSIADGRVRNSVKNKKIVRYHEYDELWFYDNTDEQYIWDYRNNVWTRREIIGRVPVSITPSNAGLVIAYSDDVVNPDRHATNYLTSFIERRRFAMSPEFDTETLASVALLVDGDDTLSLAVAGSNTPGYDPTIPVTGDPEVRAFNFDISEDYKTDIRVHGRFLNYCIAGDGQWRLSGIQLEIGKGGQR